MYDWSNLQELYVTQRLSVRDIAELKGCAYSSVQRNLLCQQIKSRSRSEATKLLWERGKRKPQNGPDNPNWRGGKKKSGGGYLAIKTPQHPRANKDSYVLEHILVWERVHNKPLPKGWVIHHLNGIKSDNQPRNLIALPYTKHHSALLTQEIKKRLRELEEENRLLRKALDEGQMIFTIPEN